MAFKNTSMLFFFLVFFFSIFCFASQTRFRQCETLPSSMCQDLLESLGGSNLLQQSTLCVIQKYEFSRVEVAFIMLPQLPVFFFFCCCFFLKLCLTSLQYTANSDPCSAANLKRSFFRAGAPAYALRGETVQMQRVHQEFHAAGPPSEAPLGAHRREAPPVRHLQEAVQQHFEPQDAPAAPFGAEALRLRPVSGQVHSVRSPETSQKAPHQRTTLHVWGLPEEVHQCQRVEVMFFVFPSSAGQLC